jgi:hypothetical protein
MRLAAVLAPACLIGLYGVACERTILDAPTGQTILKWTTPYDKEAAAAAMPYYRNADLTDYTFALLLIVQNYNKAGLAVTLEVNGQSFERRYVAGLTQEIFEVTPAMVQQTEAVLGLSAAAIEPRLLGRACPFVVRLRQYVTEDQYVIQNTNMVLAPQNFFESMSSDPASYPFDEPFTLDAHMVCPGAFVLAIRESRVDVIELDREFVGLNENNDDPNVSLSVETDFLKSPSFQYHQATQDALDRLGLGFLLDTPFDEEN